jgi:hypothetical protein
LAVSTCIHWLVEAWRKSRQSIKLVLWASYCSANYRHFIRIIKTRYSYTVNICLRINFRLSLRRSLPRTRLPTRLHSRLLHSRRLRQNGLLFLRLKSRVRFHRGNKAIGLASFLCSKEEQSTFCPRTQYTQVAWYVVAVGVGALGATYAAVPLYKVFCQTTGFAGTTQRVRIG